jgi:hypothetical protein
MRGQGPFLAHVAPDLLNVRLIAIGAFDVLLIFGVWSPFDSWSHPKRSRGFETWLVPQARADFAVRVFRNGEALIGPHMTSSVQSEARWRFLSSRVFFGGRGFHECGQADLQLDRKALGLKKIAGVDQIFVTIPLARTFFGASNYSGTGEARSSLPRRNWPDGRRLDIDRRRAPEARDGRTSVQSNPRQIDEDPNIRLGLRQIPASQSALEATQAWQTMRSLRRAARDCVAHLTGTIAHRFSVFDGQGDVSEISKPPWAV